MVLPIEEGLAKQTIQIKSCDSSEAENRLEATLLMRTTKTMERLQIK
jgi:hypothetical protein